MATEAQIIANRLNAEKSCGPKSPESKTKVSQNRTTHGLCGAFRVLACERQEEFDALVAALLASEQPADDSERELVIKMVQHSWRRFPRVADGGRLLRRGRRSEPDVYGQFPQPRNRESLPHPPDRAYQRAAKELMERRKQRQLAEIGFERKKAAETEGQRKEADAQRKAERHQTAQEIANLKKQLLEIRVAKHLIAAMNKNVSPNDVREPEFELMELKSAA